MSLAAGRIRPLAAVLALAASCASTAGCAAEPPRVESAAGASIPPPAATFDDDDKGWGKFHSKRFALTIPLPEGRAWRIDDRSTPSLTAKHDATRSVLVLRTFVEPALMNRQRCEERARELGLVPSKTMRTVEDLVTVGPEAFDTRVWAALEPGATEDAPIAGHLFAFGAFVHKCLFFHFTSDVASARDESVLSARLALVRVRILAGLVLDDFDAVGRERPR